MIEYINDSVFNTDATAIVNTVNCTGTMNAGLALEYSLRYPEMYKNYISKCKEDLIKIGQVDYYIHSNDLTIINFPTKWHFKYPSKLSWIEDGLINFTKTYKSHNITTVAFPKLGTLNGKLNWHEVKSLMEKYLSPLDIKVYICLDSNTEASGIEKQMLDIFKSLQFKNLKPDIRLTESQIIILNNNRNINRFWKIKELDGIGTTVYKKLFNYCYNIVTNGNPNEQISFLS